jgi:uncharacterized integral membrane protein
MTIPSEPPVPPPHGRSGLRGKIRPKHIGVAIVFIVLVIFMIENLKSVPIRFIGPQVHAPLFLALLISAILGALAVLAVQRLRRRG